MQLRQLEIFVVLAEELHFGKSAARLNVTQSALSQQLQRLESSVGAQLVIRTSREVSLTEAGELFLEPAKETLADANRAVVAVQDYNEGRVGRIVIGALGAGLNGPLPEIVRRFRQEAPQTILELRHYSDSASQERALLSGNLDAAVVRGVANGRSIEAVKLLDEGFIAVFPENHPMGTRRRVSLKELASESYVLWPRRLGSSFYDLIIAGCRAQGFEPRIEAVGDSIEAQLALVAAGIGISIQAESHRSIVRTGTIAVDLDPSDLEATLWLAYRRWHHSAAVDSFLRVAKEGLDTNA